MEEIRFNLRISALLRNSSVLSFITLFLSLTDAGENAFGRGRRVARLDSPTEEPVQTITLSKNVKVRFVTLALQNGGLELQFREVEIYNGPLLGNNIASLVAVNVFFLNTSLFNYSFKYIIVDNSPLENLKTDSTLSTSLWLEFQ